jgi:PII-like signaling protein
VSEKALKLTTYFGERARVGRRLLADELLDAAAHHDVALSVLLRGVQGFGAKHRLRTDRLLTLSEDLPLVSIAIDGAQRIEALRSTVAELPGEGLITVEPAGTTAADLDDFPADSEVKLTVCLGRHERIDGEPAFAAVCRVLREARVSGATVLLGVDGTTGGERRRARFFARNVGVPLLVLSVGQAARIDRALTTLRQMLPSLVFTLERAQVLKRDGQLLRHPAQAPTAIEGDSARVKLTVVTSEAARHRSRPVYLELVRRLREQGAAGATSLRGIWGFHGEHEPHGDRWLSLRRHVPVITEAIDTPERIARLFETVDELTSERGLVTGELVPTTAPFGRSPGL